MIKHLACIMDGNRRWAQQRGLPSSIGHKEGIKAVERTADFCLQYQIPYLTLYTFSIENLQRSIEEKQYIFNLLVSYFKNHGVKTFIEKNIRIRFIGDRSLFPTQIIQACSEMEDHTAHHTALTIHFLFCYGGRQELTAAVQQIAHKIENGTLAADSISEKTITQHLWLSDIPDPELVIRAGKVQRLSNFLLYQSAYSELYFTDTLWPDITDTHLTDALNYLQQCQRNFGR